VTRGLGVLTAVALLGSLVSGCGGSAAGDEETRPDGRLVLVSGRDDHGQPAAETVAVYGEPAGTSPVGEIADGTLVHVSDVEGTWLRVSTAEGPAAEGWVDDYFLRGVVHLVGPAPSCRGQLGGREVDAGLQVVVSALRGGRVLVSSASDPGLRGWVVRDDVQELPPQGPACGAEPPGSPHGH
jgi:hypothetical protein